MRENDGINENLTDGLSEENIRQLRSIIPSDDLITSEILTRLRDGDHESFKLVYLHWRQPILRLLSNLTGSEAEADDITQDIFATLWLNREKVDPERNVRSLLFLMARRTAYKSIRSQLIRDRYADSVWPDESDDLTSHDIVVEKEALLLKEAVLQNVSQQQRRIFEMKHNEGLSAEEIASRLNIKRETVYNQLSIVKNKITGAILTFLVMFMAHASDDSIRQLVRSIIN